MQHPTSTLMVAGIVPFAKMEGDVYPVMSVPTVPWEGAYSLQRVKTVRDFPTPSKVDVVTFVR